MLKKTLLTAMFAVLILAALAMAADWDGTPWNLEFDGSGDPVDQGWTENGNITSSTIQFDTKFSPQGGTVGWLTATGNPGGGYKIQDPGFTKAAGWTLEWRVALENTAAIGGYAVRVIDDYNWVHVGYDETAGTVSLLPDWGETPVVISVDLSGHVERTYRLVKLAGSNIAELYIDNSPTAAGQMTLEDHYDAPPNDNVVTFAASSLNAAWDHWRYHIGGTVTPEPVTMLVLALGGLAALLRRKR